MKWNPLTSVYTPPRCIHPKIINDTIAEPGALISQTDFVIKAEEGVVR
jgi:hypothetical protein